MQSAVSDLLLLSWLPAGLQAPDQLTRPPSESPRPRRRPPLPNRSAPPPLPLTCQDTTAVRARPTPTPGRIAGLGLASFARASEPLKLLTTLPADKADGVPVGGAACLDPLKARAADCPRIVVQFNHPVVPLTGVADAMTLPSPISIAPPPREVRWLNTSTYVFRPDSLQPSTEMHGHGEPDQRGWREARRTPALQLHDRLRRPPRRRPTDGAVMVSATQPISVTFNQPMNQAEAQAAFSLRAEGGSRSGRAVPLGE
ncbi:MAG: hypothetical protein KIS91_04465 [Anaerolineae bacterium]|nr:hypothetical protein [Anaerolineae bacterium]